MNKIAEKVKISNNGVRCMLQCMKETGSGQDKKRPGRPKRTSPRQDEHLKLLSLHDRIRSSQQLTNEMTAGLNINISYCTVHRRLIAAGLHDRIAAKKPQNKVNGLKLVRQHQD